MPEYINRDYYNEFQQFLIQHNIRNFAAWEVLNCNRDLSLKITKNGVVNYPPIKRLWVNCIETLQIIEQARAELGNTGIQLNSFWRCPAYNRDVGGSTNSYHVRFMAGDFAPLNYEPFKLYDWLNRSVHHERFGVQLYSTFVHFDNRNVVYRRRH